MPIYRKITTMSCLHFKHNECTLALHVASIGDELSDWEIEKHENWTKKSCKLIGN